MKGCVKYTWVVGLFVWQMTIAGQTGKEITLTFSADQFEQISVDENLHLVRPVDDDNYFFGNPEEPALPVRIVRILIPASAEHIDLQVIDYEETLFAGDIDLGRNHSHYPTDGPLPYGLENNQLFLGNYDPPKVANVRENQMQGSRWVSFEVSPFRYDGSTRKLFLVGELHLKVGYNLQPDPNLRRRSDRSILQFLEKTVENPEDIDLSGLTEVGSTLKANQERVDYLIITSHELKDSFEPLIRWKRRKGFYAEVVAVEEIYQRYSEGTDQMKIKKHLLDYYQNKGLKFVLLGGDDNVIPVQGCYTRIYLSGSFLEDPSVPTDQFYACFDKRLDWNSNLDEKVGEFFVDGNDIFPDVYLTRIPVRNSSHVETFVEKTLRYELHPPMKGFAGRMLLSGVKSWNVWNGKSDNHHRNEIMFQKYIARGWEGEKFRFYDTGTDFEGGSSFQVSTENLRKTLNEGFGYFHYAGHGNVDSYLMEFGSPFNSVDAYQLTNPAHGFMMSTSCDVNAFDSTENCLSEAFLRNPKGGCVAFFGSSRQGFGLTGTSSLLGSSFRYNAQFLETLVNGDPYQHGNSLGVVAALSKASLANHGGSSGVYNYLQYALNTMGDPELPLYTRDPSLFDQVRIYSLGNTLTVNTGGIDNCRICVTSLELDEGYLEVAEGSGHQVFTDVPSHFQVTITRANYIPYIFKSSLATTRHDQTVGALSIYPNPARTTFTVELDQPMGQLKIMDLHGRLLYEEELRPGSNQISVDQMPPGSYLISVESAREIQRTILIRQ